MERDSVSHKIEIAANKIGNTWPLYAFVTSNPLSGYEKTHFEKATLEAEQLRGGHLLPEASVLKKALDNKEIDRKLLENLFHKNEIDITVEESLKKIMTLSRSALKNPSHEVDRILIKWLMAFMDEGLAEWSFPNKERGFYKAWKSLAKYDNDLNLNDSLELPNNALDLLNYLLKDYSEKDQLKILEYHIARLPGWTGYIKYRTQTNSEWNLRYSITLEDYLAVRLCITQHLNFKVLPLETEIDKTNKERRLQYLWLKAWEASWQNRMSKQLEDLLQVEPPPTSDSKDIPKAQLVFCIDTRSELIRRQVESQGNYETFGYAGFFGIAMDYEDLSTSILKKSCPPILASTYKVTEKAKPNHQTEVFDYHKQKQKEKFTSYFLKRMKHMLPSAFGYVEGSGFFYGISLFLRTMVPERLYNSKKKESNSFESICDPQIHNADTKSSKEEISLKEKTAIVKTAFDLTGWKNFSKLILFVGHESHTVNNPFGSSLDCGACAASPGRHNARMLAKLANEPEVREALKTFNIHIPESTFFLGAEHNTTTDEILIFDTDIPNAHQKELSDLKRDLSKAQNFAIKERLGTHKNNLKRAYKKTNDWSETRPEWGLAKNAGFIIGPRRLSETINLNGNCFLHSYDWEMDPEGLALEGIMQGPMVVTQWINNHYYFSTVDNENYGAGTKITHNVTGTYGVMQGNGGDLKIGLPLQSVNLTDDTFYHQPLRLSVYINAPKTMVIKILKQNEHLKSLLDNEWIYLLVIDPNEDHKIIKYVYDLTWEIT